MKLLTRTKRKTHSIVRTDQDTKARVDQLHAWLGCRTYNETMKHVLDKYSVMQQLVQELQTFTHEFGTVADTPLETLQALVAAYRSAGKGKQDAAVSQHLEQRWGSAISEVDALFQQVIEAGEPRPVPYLSTLIGKQHNFHREATKRREQYAETDYRRLSFSQLQGIKTPEAVRERIRRTVTALIQHNQQTRNPQERWYLNAIVVHDLIGGRYPAINQYFAEHQQEIDHHNQLFRLSFRHNQKPLAVSDMIQIPEEPEYEPKVSIGLVSSNL